MKNDCFVFNKTRLAGCALLENKQGFKESEKIIKVLEQIYN
ncbi:MAG: hypothetical protein SOZ73_03785 [Campylobacter sp.]|nr:hypothetical protein [Campylobacter sp.]MDY3776333.1 hypothetical protein [Campylobacter sp.]